MERKTSGEIKGQTAEPVWPFLADFCNLQQWFRSTLDTCYPVEGVPGQPGVVISGPPTPLILLTEKLLMIDPIKQHLSYKMVTTISGSSPIYRMVAALGARSSGHLLAENRLRAENMKILLIFLPLP
ncbi:lachrymatory-factor synthase-like [Prunus yedoensis var. nudiflora]|uniref:Lachrymatory-factor synthase-like n=1 Tax=Prunus yedoensis var. nudiflora TaxID=2094558 RepID=A0A314UDN5_PRUYE|nr:lachrymatory-factor synthase-like [Prunus yedoensis var. nudiflora]